MASKAAIPRVCGRPIGPVGFGMMGLTAIPIFPKLEREYQVSVLKKALDQSANLWNGGLHYGTPDSNSVHLMRCYFEKYPEDAEKVFLHIKGAFSHGVGPTGSPEAIRASVEQALEGLGGAKIIDIFEMGKIGGIGLSEVNANTIRKAHAVHPIAAVEVELSLFTPDPLNNGIMDACQELGIPVIAYSPVGRGWLTGQFKKLDDLAPDDYRRQHLDRFKPEVFEQNYKLVEAIESITDRKGLKTSQVAIAWVVRQGAIPIPGSTNVDRVTMNSQLSELTEEDMLDLQKAQNNFPVAGK